MKKKDKQFDLLQGTPVTLILFYKQHIIKKTSFGPMLIRQNECMVGIEPQTQNKLCRKWETEENLTLYYFGLIIERIKRSKFFGICWALIGCTYPAS